MVESGLDGPRYPECRCGELSVCRDAGQWRDLPKPDDCGRHHRIQPGHGHCRSALAENYPRGKHFHRLSLRGRFHLDAARFGHLVQHARHRLLRPRAYLPHEQRPCRCQLQQHHIRRSAAADPRHRQPHGSGHGRRRLLLPRD